MKAAIIAGGTGTRMGKISETIPKPMLPIGGKPILEHQIELLRQSGIRDITLCTRHLSPVIADYFGDGRRWGAKISYSGEAVPLGTAGCLRRAFPKADQALLVLYGDVMVWMDLAEMIRRHRSSAAAATLAVHSSDHPFDSDLLEVDGEMRVVRFLPKPHPEGAWLPNLTNAGVYVLGPALLRCIPEGRPTDCARDIFPEALQRGLYLHAYRTAEYIKDAGTPDRYPEVIEDWDSGKAARMRRENPRPAVFLDRDGVLVREVGHLCRPEDLELLPGAAEALRDINAAGYLAIMVTNQPVIARGICTIAELGVIHNKLETLLGRKGARLDAIYFCPHHPDRGFPGEVPDLKIPCECRKPGTLLIERARREFNIDLSSSWMIGDTTVDLETARRTGIKSVLVATGYGGSDGRYPVEPDERCGDLSQAVARITGFSKPEPGKGL
ncbi:MAG: HAD-IIIA family hydrolase [PVC group bacterium]